MAAGRRAHAFAALAIAGALVPVATAIEWYGSLLADYTGGPGFEASFAVSEFTPSLPLTARLGIGYHTLDPGKPAEARRIFINNATNGVPEKHGRVWVSTAACPWGAAQRWS